MLAISRVGKVNFGHFGQGSAGVVVHRLILITRAGKNATRDHRSVPDWHSRYRQSAPPTGPPRLRSTICCSGNAGPARLSRHGGRCCRAAARGRKPRPGSFRESKLKSEDLSPLEWRFALDLTQEPRRGFSAAALVRSILNTSPFRQRRPKAPKRRRSAQCEPRGASRCLGRNLVWGKMGKSENSGPPKRHRRTGSSLTANA
jgi:hypothetical protein